MVLATMGKVSQYLVEGVHNKDALTSYNKISCEEQDCDLFVQDKLCIHKKNTGENE